MHTHAHIQALKEFVHDGVFSAYWDAVDHFGTTDLVVCLTGDDAAFIDVYVREEVLSVAEVLPPAFKEMLSNPATSNPEGVLKDACTVFWLLLFVNNETIVASIAAKQLSPGGSA